MMKQMGLDPSMLKMMGMDPSMMMPLGTIPWITRGDRSWSSEVSGGRGFKSDTRSPDSSTAAAPWKRAPCLSDLVSGFQVWRPMEVVLKGSHCHMS